MPHPSFRTFWQAGFESANHINGRYQRVDMLAATQHDHSVAEDYARLRPFGMGVVREGLRWPLIERDGRFDWSSVGPMATAARDHDLQVIWTLCHYGWPDDLDVFSPAFVARFARYAAAVATLLARQVPAPRWYAPINEISFLAFAAGEVGWFHPFATGRGDDLKAQLVRATLAAIAAIRAIDPTARFLQAEPLIHIVPPPGRSELAPAAARERAAQFAAWDWLLGRQRPELGGHPHALDVLGVNYYHANQWEYPSQPLRWDGDRRDPRRWPVHRLLAEVSGRYHRPLLMAETSHSGQQRGPWLREVAAEVGRALGQGVPVRGLCLYPILNRPDWHDRDHWHQSGLWRLTPDGRGGLARALEAGYAADLRRAQRELRGALATSEGGDAVTRLASGRRRG